MKILVDTNILINLEDNKVIDDQFSKFYNLAIANQCVVCYHPAAIPKDIQRDKNAERRDIIISKLKKYQKLENPAKLPDDFLNEYSARKDNDICDNQQLYQLVKEYVDILVTQDNGIHKKATKIGFNEKVLKIKDAVNLLEQTYSIVIPNHPILEHDSIRKLEPDFDSAFFDSLKADYGLDNFQKWISKCVTENRKCYNVKSDNKLVGLLIYNIEEPIDHQIANLYEYVVKICTLKIDDSLFGLKLGELFLHKMFEYCVTNKTNYLYLTVYEKQITLIDLLVKFGFERSEFQNKQGKQEIRMIKNLNKSLINSTDNKIKHHPFYSDKQETAKFVIPIMPHFYNTLFKDGALREYGLFDKLEEGIKEIQGNSILKAYVSSSRITNLKQGDILLFYASKRSQVIEPLGILESITVVTEFTQLWSIVHKKTVFSQEELKKLLEKKGKLHVITFRLITYLKRPIQLKEIQQIDSFKNKLQTITRIQETDYQKLKEDGYFDKRYIIN